MFVSHPQNLCCLLQSHRWGRAWRSAVNAPECSVQNSRQSAGQNDHQACTYTAEIPKKDKIMNKEENNKTKPEQNKNRVALQMSWVIWWIKAEPMLTAIIPFQFMPSFIKTQSLPTLLNTES